MTPEEGIQMIKASRVLLLPNWDIDNAMGFNSFIDKISVEDMGKKEMKGAKFSEDNVALVIFSMRKGSRTSSS